MITKLNFWNIKGLSHQVGFGDYKMGFMTIAQLSFCHIILNELFDEFYENFNISKLLKRFWEVFQFEGDVQWSQILIF